MSEEEAELEFVKRAAVEVIRQMTEARQHVLEQHSHSFKWLTASLLAVNGGAAVAILSNANLQSATKVLAGACFSLGIFSALLIGVTGQMSNQRSLVPLNKVIGYWLAVSQDGERAEEVEAEHERLFQPSRRLALIAQILGWMSAAFLALGMVTIGLEIVREGNLVHGESTRIGGSSPGSSFKPHDR